KNEALLKIDPKQLDALLHPTFGSATLKGATPIASGLPASPGAAVGKIAFTAEEATERHAKGEKIILVRLETSPEDIEGMNVAQGILTARGGLTSHAAVVARGMGRCCVAGSADLVIDEAKKTLTIKGKVYTGKDILSLNGDTGLVYAGELAVTEPEISGSFQTIMEWANAAKKLKVRANADTPKDAKAAYDFGATGIGLCRTEHMFFEASRIKSMREMIVAKSVEQRESALAKLLPMQREDFIGIYEAMQGNPVTIRFLDPPLHEFLPKKKKEIEELATDLGMTTKELDAVILSLHEENPMMGHRGLRLSVTYPEIVEMQTRAVIEAAIEVNKKGLKVVPEIMIPLTCEVKEFKFVKDVVVETAKAVMKEAGLKIKYLVGTMIEIPRAAITADKIAVEAEFFSFGTNDLTQMTFGFSRDDAGKFLGEYYSKKIFESDPFARLDQEGVGFLVQTAVEKGKSVRKDIKLGICGEHGGDPATIEFCHNAGLTYVSCSPFRVPIAILASAQAAVKK
ncbi:MAG: PEP-utilizing enzyme, partial [Firmicutes bacterium]|nr:PEP-utilizing enzyme [Bacillota bacterium]